MKGTGLKISKLLKASRLVLKYDQTHAFVDKINILKSDLGLHDFSEMGPKYGIIRVSVDLVG